MTFGEFILLLLFILIYVDYINDRIDETEDYKRKLDEDESQGEDKDK